MNEAFLGIQYGLFLSILVGPLVFLLVQACFERGLLAGLVVGSGIWISDLLYIIAVQLCYTQLRFLSDQALFPLVFGGGGGVLLIGMGIQLLRNNSQPIKDLSTGSLFTDWIQGFLVNTINPFTVFFWLLVMSTVVVQGAYTPQQSRYFFMALLGTIIATDTTKILLAKKLRPYLVGHSLSKIRKINAAAILLFGIALMVRSFLVPIE